ncbi:VanZ family protein [Paenibacillus lemnae]|uniref:VanZ family protein n=1 Tax=Paenibacillus lemnae TaxID=1330551 RepID=A0A848M8Y1_PAELE|nr:VanZ family protein [Paenibacillus lemnae]NMO96640.1 VanZ family protein [Paenibacillus lemnae]
MPKLFRWLPAVLVMVIIFLFSSQPYHEQDLRPSLKGSFVTDSLARSLSGIHFQYAGSEISASALGNAGVLEFLIRKGAHLSIYALLGFALVYAFNAKRPWRGYSSAVLISFLYACSDEFHQSLTPDRTPLLQDVIVDTIGAILGAGLMVLLKAHADRKQLT